ncbi:2,5-dichloro-2,5-cyclohexadiene-1,4-diol dehydrogenase [Coccidioides immitis RMSCC 3703]|uniref:2,5-dichloro-2,5-cyclohexadiene-1,4-diol dehydrogenase n=1 Tax=Coccidioides immitis RMSCC 3703 TaxID=454286 RepID=A0A0J8QLB1_COCIT|nr:2,5-dichloro-2,5-cyclohexadiene-1,4-diol dehydrogenase [Coccidioides immitis RMSCC 3703]
MSTTGSRLAGKVAIVTGGGSGFGAAIAIRYAQEGAKVVIGDINIQGAESVSSQYPSSITFQKMDVTSLADWQSVISQTVQAHGHVDILVNNAGTTYRNKPSAEVTIEEFQRVFDVNVKSIFLASQTFIPKLIDQGKGGSIINISSTGAQRPRPGLVWYNSSKGAVSNATKGPPLPSMVHIRFVSTMFALSLSGTGLLRCLSVSRIPLRTGNSLSPMYPWADLPIPTMWPICVYILPPMRQPSSMAPIWLSMVESVYDNLRKFFPV